MQRVICQPNNHALFAKMVLSQTQLEKYNYRNVNDRAVLKLQYAKKHKTSKKDFKEAFSIIFVDTTKNYSDLNFFKTKWINKLEATININKTILQLHR